MLATAYTSRYVFILLLSVFLYHNYSYCMYICLLASTSMLTIPVSIYIPWIIRDKSIPNDPWNVN